MAANTAIEWCDHTWNPWRGCAHATLPSGSPHAGCENCYAEAMAKRNPKTLGVWGDDGRRIVGTEAYWSLPYKWNAAAERGECPKCRGHGMVPLQSVSIVGGEPVVLDDGTRCDRCHGTGNVGPHRRKAFCASLADICEDWPGVMRDVSGCDVGSMPEIRKQVVDVFAATQATDWIVLTKRPGNVRSMIPPMGNVWIVASVSDQQSYDETVDAMNDLRYLFPVRGLSVEPLVGPIDYRAKIPPHYASHLRKDRINWLIVGGESGADARPCKIDWIRDAIKIGRETGVAVFVKQVGTRPVTRLPAGEVWPGHSGPSSAVQFSGDGFGRYLVTGLRAKKGGDPAEWPADIRVREYPR